jgi:hypothetical protein
MELRAIGRSNFRAQETRCDALMARMGDMAFAPPASSWQAKGGESKV